MSEKLIIDNRTEMEMESVLSLAMKVLNSGRVTKTGKEYPYKITEFEFENVKYEMQRVLNKKSVKMIFYKVGDNLK